MRTVVRRLNGRKVVIIGWSVIGRLFQGGISARLLTAFSNVILRCFLNHVVEMAVRSFVPLRLCGPPTHPHLLRLAEQGGLVQTDVLDPLDFLLALSFPFVDVEAALLVLKALEHSLVLAGDPVTLLLALRPV